MPDTIDAFMEATSNMASPRLFRLWTAISIVSSAMSRRVWTAIEDDLKLFPNTFIMLVSKPGIGKSRPMSLAQTLLAELSSSAFAGDEVTREEMVQHMGEVFHERAPEGSRSFLAVISEFATFMPKADLAWMQAIARLWDCPDIYIRRTKHMGQDFLHFPYMCMLAGAQPAWFAEGFPASAYEMGLPTRIHFIYADQKPHREFFRDKKQVTGLNEVRAGLKALQKMHGHVPWEQAAQDEFKRWEAEGFPPAPDDPMLSGYGIRRDMHIGKLSLISAGSAHPAEPIIRLSDLERARVWLLEAEQGAPLALQAAGGNTYRLREEAIIHFVGARYAATGKAVNEYVVRQSLGRLVPPQAVGPIIDELIAQHRLTVLGAGEAPHRLLRPSKEARL